MILSALLALALFVPGVKAQTINFGPKVGGNLSWVSKLREVDTGKKGIDFPRWSLHGGVYGEYMFNDTWGIRVEELYAGVGSRKDKNNKGKLGYLTIPVLAKLHLPSGLSFHLGPQVGFLLSAKAFLLNQVGEVPYKDKDVRENFKNIDFAIVGGAEYAFESGLIVGARYNFGVVDIDKDEDKRKSDDKLTNQFIQVYAGYNLAKVLAK
ncbi:MAG: PorT family protein [Cytophagales bacterium]|nr:PorT family protein [Cytophagales bacterium]